MGATTGRFLIAAALICVASGQTPEGQSVERVLRIEHAETGQELSKLADVVRLMLQILPPFTDPTERTMTMRGSPAQLALAEWLASELSRPAAGQGPAAHEYQVRAAGDDVVKVLCLNHLEAVHDLQEVAMAAFSLVDPRRMVTYTPRMAIAVRGTPRRIAIAE